MLGKAFNTLMGGAIKKVRKPEPLKKTGKAAAIGAAMGAGAGRVAKRSSSLKVTSNNGGSQKTQRSAQLHKLSPGVEITPNQMLRSGKMKSPMPIRGRRALPMKMKKMKYAERKPM